MYTILAVDDSVINLAMTRMILRSTYDVRIARTASAAMAVLDNAWVDLILLDINMPDISGFDLMTKIRGMAAHKNTPIMFVTSNASKTFLLRAVSMKAADYMVKPVVHAVLMEKIARVLTGRKETIRQEAFDLSGLNPNQSAKERLLDGFTMLSYACISGKCDAVESLVTQLRSGNFGAIVNKSLDAMKELLITYEYENIQKLISTLVHDLSKGTLVI
ncbi:MAG: response regulator [Treponema sp.]|jgi:PleD family two-component response regulator|nr:response regulator [Treponema sp.]